MVERPPAPWRTNEVSRGQRVADRGTLRVVGVDTAAAGRAEVAFSGRELRALGWLLTARPPTDLGELGGAGRLVDALQAT